MESNDHSVLIDLWAINYLPEDSILRKHRRHKVLQKLFVAPGFPGGTVVKNLPASAGDPSLGQKDPLEEEMATHSSILAWKIPWTEETGWLSMGWQRV